MLYSTCKGTKNIVITYFLQEMKVLVANYYPKSLPTRSKMFFTDCLFGMDITIKSCKGTTFSRPPQQIPQNLQIKQKPHPPLRIRAIIYQDLKAQNPRNHLFFHTKSGKHFVNREKKLYFCGV